MVTVYPHSNKSAWAWLLLLLCTVPGVNYAWQEFQDELKEKAVAQLKASSADSTGDAIAGSIYQYAQYFCVFVWKAAVPAEYQHGVRVSAGVSKRPTKPNGKLMNYSAPTLIRSGMVPLLYCKLSYEDQKLRDDPVLGRYNWPCPIGGATALEAPGQDAVSRNCIIFYNRFHSIPQTPQSLEGLEERWRILDEAIKFCEAAQLAQLKAEGYVDMTTLAVCVYGAYPTGLPGNAPRASQFLQLAMLRGVAVIPIPFPRPPGQRADEEPGYGLNAPDGDVVILRSANPFLNLDVPPLDLRYVLAFSNVVL